ncbi:MAG: PilZ domain-containing protein [Polyangiales bacterium]
MIRVATTFRDREALANAQRGAGEDVLFVPDCSAASVGSAILVQVDAVGLAAGLFVEGVVAWRRLQNLPGLPRGCGVRVLSSHVDRLAFLRRWSTGEVSASSREYWRYPCSEKVLISFAGAKRSTQRLVHGTVEDVSAKGALLVTPSPVVGATDVLLDFHSGPKVPVPARVVWAQGNRCGLELRGGGRDEDLAWSELLERVARATEPELRVAS